ncbi:MAG: hypothetical protein M1819_003471 [Sarea resinae]|nr:MAG: hypothetical protein M1819_003471 [Sarea resinae]
MTTIQEPPIFDILKATATDLRASLENGELTSVQIVTRCLEQIEKHNRAGLGLRAVISAAPRDIVIAQAEQLDLERANGKLRGPLHGIPIIVKDAMMTSAASGMPTTAGAVAFEDCYAKQNAPAIESLLQQGLIILAKASMTEFCGHKATCMTAGWCAINGQTQSAYIKGGVREDDLFMGRSTPGGSSTGSAVGVSAGFAPLSLGTDTSGSICMPANRAGLYSIKATQGSILMDGVFALSRDFDAIGAMAKSPHDLALIMDALNGSMTGHSGKAGWSDVAVGFVDPTIWDALQFQRSREGDVEKQILTGYEWAMAQIRQRGGKVAYPVELPTREKLFYKGKSVLHSVAFKQFPSLFQDFCSGLDNPKVHSLPELIQFNKDNASRAMPEPPTTQTAHPNQSDLLASLASTMTSADAAAATTHGRRLARAAIDHALALHGVDFLLGPGDCSICGPASLAGYPTAMVPLGVLHGDQGMGQPQGLMMLGPAGSEGTMLRFMGLWADVVGAWEVPALLRDEEEGV